MLYRKISTVLSILLNHDYSKSQFILNRFLRFSVRNVCLTLYLKLSKFQLLPDYVLE